VTLRLTAADLDLLTDTNGDPYDPAVLPCTSWPELWDDKIDLPDGQQETPAARRDRHNEAKRHCAHCPAARACAAKARRLPLHEVDGVWAGKIRSRKQQEWDPPPEQIIGVWQQQILDGHRKGRTA
jgi:hypothetical protein